MTNFIAQLIYKLTNGAHTLLAPFVPEETLLKWKPIHLCWWFHKHELPTPKYFIGMDNIPSITTNAATDITHNSFTGNGNINNQGNTSNITTRGFAYYAGTEGDPTTANSTVSETGSWASGSGAFSLPITGLSASTSYRVRAYGINGGGTGYGVTITVTTDAAAQNHTRSLSDALLISAEISNRPPTIALNTPDEEVFYGNPKLLFTGTDPELDRLCYEIRILEE